jgi:hypothetical protein
MSHGIVVECERITPTRGTGSVTRSTAGKLGMLGRGGAARLPGVQVAKAAQNSRKRRSQLRSSTCEPEVGGKGRIYTQAHGIRKSGQATLGPSRGRLTGAGLGSPSTRFDNAEISRKRTAWHC